MEEDLVQYNPCVIIEMAIQCLNDPDKMRLTVRNVGTDPAYNLRVHYNLYKNPGGIFLDKLEAGDKFSVSVPFPRRVLRKYSFRLEYEDVQGVYIPEPGEVYRKY